MRAQDNRRAGGDDARTVSGHLVRAEPVVQPARRHRWPVFVLPDGACAGILNEGDEMVTALNRPPLRKRLTEGQGGQSIVEFALISLLMLMTTFGIIDLGRAVFDRTMLTNAVREAARAGMVDDSQRAGAATPDNSNCAMNGTTETYCSKIVAAAQKRSPSLGLTADNFRVNGLSGGQIMIGCSKWNVASSGWWNGNDGTLPNCHRVNGSARNPGDRLTVCATYRFGLTAPRLIGFDSITMRECARVSLR